jgi:hypothetical protein
MDDDRSSILRGTMFRTSPIRLLSNAVSSARCMQPVQPAKLAEFGRILSEPQPRRVQHGRFLHFYHYRRGWHPREITGKSQSMAASQEGRPRRQARRVDGFVSRHAPLVLLDREFFSKMRRLAFERGGRRAILRNLLRCWRTKAPAAWAYLICGQISLPVELGRSIT